MKRRTDKNTFRRAQSISRLATADESRNSSNSSPRVRYERFFSWYLPDFDVSSILGSFRSPGSRTFESGITQLSREKRAVGTIPSPHTRAKLRPHPKRRSPVAPHLTRGAAWAPLRTGREEAPAEMGEVRGDRATSSPRYARARSSGKHAPPPARRVSALLRTRDVGVRRARISLEVYLPRHRGKRR